MRLCACGCGRRTSDGIAEYIRSHRPRISLAEALSRGFSPSSEGCWEWGRYIRPAGYGMLGIPGTRKTMDAHRASWLVHVGPIPPGMFVCHHCDNKKCVRPDHLFLGTLQDNVDDAVAKGIIKRTRARGEAAGSSKLTNADVDEIRRRYRRGVHPARKTGGSSSELAAEFGVTRQYVAQLSLGVWRAA